MNTKLFEPSLKNLSACIMCNANRKTIMLNIPPMIVSDAEKDQLSLTNSY